MQLQRIGGPTQPTGSAAPAAASLSGPDVKIVALGDSLTAGTQDACTIQSRQGHSYIAQVARQAQVPFGLPLINQEGIPFSIWHDQSIDMKHFNRELKWLKVLDAPLGLCTYFIGAPPVVLPMWNLLGDFGKRTKESRNTPEHPQSNFAVPGFELRHLYNIRNEKDYLREIHQGMDGLSDIGAIVPGVRAILGNGTCSGSGSQVDQALKQNPDLVVVWAGGNDAIAPLFAGNVQDSNLTPVDDRQWNVSFENPITGKVHWEKTKNVIPGFRTQVLGKDGLMDKLLHGSQAEIVMLNVPDVTSIPMMREVGKPVGRLPFHIDLPDGTDVTSTLENWTIPTTIVGPGKNGRTQFPPGSRVPLTTILEMLAKSGAPKTATDLQICCDMGKQKGIFTEDDVMDPDELSQVQQHIQDYNQVLTAASQLSPRVHLIDVKKMLDDARNGRPLRGAGPDEVIVPGFTGVPDAQGRDGIYSLDGVHPSDTGHAMIANLVLDRVRADLGNQDRFKRFQNIPPIDEKAAHHADPHTTRAVPNSIVLDKEHIQQWRDALGG